MEREIEVFMYDYGGVFDIRIYVNIHFPKIVSTVFIGEDQTKEEKKFYPIEYDKVLGTFNQYLIGLGLNSILPDPTIYKHMEEMTKFLKLINTITFEKLARGVLLQFLRVVKDGVRIWGTFFRTLPSQFDEIECKRIVKLFNRYLMMYHLLLWEHEQRDVGITRSPLWSK